METKTNIREANVIKAVVYNTDANGEPDVTSYRVTLTKAIKGYRTVNGERVETDVISYIVPRNVFLAQILNRIPMAARIYDKAKKAFVAEHGKDAIMPFIDELNIFVKDADVVLDCTYHAAGETYQSVDGTQCAHKYDKWNIELVEITPGALGSQTIAALEERERQAAMAQLAAILGV